MNKPERTLDQVAALLKRVTIRREAVAEALLMVSRDLAPKFEYFGFVRLDENTLSSIFADMLNPKGSHGQREIFLQMFLKMIGLADQKISGDVTVETEKQIIGQRRIDIFLRVGGSVLAIENKPWADDQDRQLHDYAVYTESEAKKEQGSGVWRLVYLSNDEPGEKSLRPDEREKMVKDGHFLRVDFRKAADWVEACAKETRALRVRVFLEELMKYIRSEINGDLEMNEAEEVKKIAIDSPESIEATFALHQVWRSVQIDLLGILKKAIDVELMNRGTPIKLIWKPEEAVESKELESFERYAGFGFKIDDNQEIYLRFEFESSNLNDFYWGMCRNNDKIAKDQTRWAKISEVMTSLMGRRGKEGDWWPWYLTESNRLFDDGCRDWGQSPKPWVEIHRGTLAERLVELATEVYKQFQSDNQFSLLLPS